MCKLGDRSQKPTQGGAGQKMRDAVGKKAFCAHTFRSKIQGRLGYVP
ncbi:hypothetical protein SME38J_38720 [Serratia marcescens]|nr:hypothetical protein SME38J_38720 [Serratia marcescens]